jgi:hypothetical protein
MPPCSQQSMPCIPAFANRTWARPTRFKISLRACRIFVLYPAPPCCPICHTVHARCDNISIQDSRCNVHQFSRSTGISLLSPQKRQNYQNDKTDLRLAAMALRSGKKRQRGRIIASIFSLAASCAILGSSLAVLVEGRGLDIQLRPHHQVLRQGEIARNEFIDRKSFFVRGGSDRPFISSSASSQGWRPVTTTTTNNSSGKQSTKMNTLVKSEEPFWSKLSQNDQGEDEKEQTKEMIDAFLTRDSRQTFVTRVYAILTGQLMLTALSVIGFSNNRQLAYWFLTKGKIGEW